MSIEGNYCILKEQFSIWRLIMEHQNNAASQLKTFSLPYLRFNLPVGQSNLCFSPAINAHSLLLHLLGGATGNETAPHLKCEVTLLEADQSSELGLF
jgi:hypothetical protein